MHGFVPDQQVQSLAAFINGGSAGKRQGNAEAVIGKIKIEAAIGNIAVVCHARVIHILQKGGLIIVVAVHKAMNSPWASRSPVLRAADKPAFSWRTDLS